MAADDGATGAPVSWHSLYLYPNPRRLRAAPVEQEMSKNWRRSVLPALLLLALPVIAVAQVGISISVNTPPPELPVYEQPPIPDEGYLWTPGYWAWSDDIQDYYWVPGTWVLAPQPGYLWTPGYWGAEGAVFLWHTGYWGPEVGFYGGVNYGYGYGGRGYEGGYWRDGRLYYNRSVTNITNTNITNVYNKTVINNVTVNRVSYNGGGGVRAQPTSAELAAEHARHIPATSAQQQHVQLALGNPALRVSENHGAPPIAATARPGAFSGAGVVAARHGGTMSVYHQGGAAERAVPTERGAPPPQPRPGAAAQPYPAQPRPPQTREVPPEQYRAPPRPPAAEQYRAPPPPHPPEHEQYAAPPHPPAQEQYRAPPPHPPAAESAHPSPPPRPRPPEHPPEHDHDRS
jgi:hypothetical protein